MRRKNLRFRCCDSMSEMMTKILKMMKANGDKDGTSNGMYRMWNGE